jgi:hypothetical protein
LSSGTQNGSRHLAICDRMKEPSVLEPVVIVDDKHDIDGFLVRDAFQVVCRRLSLHEISLVILFDAFQHVLENGRGDEGA